MKIDNSVKGAPSTVTDSVQRQPANKATAGPAGPASPASAQVQLSSMASLGVDKVLAETPVADANKIAEIKQAIAEGRFTVNADKIADGLLDSVRQLLGRSGSGA